MRDVRSNEAAGAGISGRTAGQDSRRLLLHPAHCSCSCSAVVLLQLPIQRLSPDAEGAGGVGFVSLGVVEGGFDRLAFDLFHRRRNGNLKSRRATFARSLRSFNFDPVALLQSDLADRFR